MMNYSEFKQGLMSALEQAFGSEYEINTKSCFKSNLGEVEAIEITTEKYGMGPVIYPEFLYRDYEDGKSIDMMVEDVRPYVGKMGDAKNVFQKAVDDRDFILSNVYYKMLNEEMNRNYLETVIYRKAEGFDDIALVPIVKVEAPDGRTGYLAVTRSLANQYESQQGISIDDLFNAANRNSDRVMRFCSLDDVLREMMPDAMLPVESPFYVMHAGISTEVAPLGAKELMASIYDKIGPHYVIPSSVHEILFLPKSFEDSEERLKEIVHEVNSEVLQPQEVLSGSIYECQDGKYRTIRAEGTQGAAVGDEQGMVNYGPAVSV